MFTVAHDPFVFNPVVGKKYYGQFNGDNWEAVASYDEEAEMTKVGFETADYFVEIRSGSDGVTIITSLTAGTYPMSISEAGDNYIKTIDSKFIPEHEHSWNDLEDKPFCEEGEITEIMSERQVPWVADMDGFGLEGADVPTLIVDETYIINWNGTEYACTAIDSAVAGEPGGVILGDIYTMSGGQVGSASTGEPFAMAVQANTMFMAVPLDGSTELTLSIKQDTTTIHHIDPKFIKDMYYEESGDTEILSNDQIVRIDDDGDGTVDGIGLPIDLELVAGDTYIINYNGTDYTCVGQDASALVGAPCVCLGDLSSEGLAGNGEPFAIMWCPTMLSANGVSGQVMPVDGVVPESLSIKSTAATIHHIPSKYIKDMYYEEAGAGVVLPETTISFTDGEGELPIAIPLIADHIYTVMWNGVAYDCVAQASSIQGVTIATLGYSNMFGGVDNGEPFFVATVPIMGASVVGPRGNSVSEATISIEEGSVVHKIPEKFLPVAGTEFGAVKTTSEVTDTTDLTACPIIDGVPYYKEGGEVSVGSLADMGVTATAAELNYVDGVTSNIQTQLDGKQNVIELTADCALISNSDGGIDTSIVTSTELGHLSGVTSSVQTQLDTKPGLIVNEYGAERFNDPTNSVSGQYSHAEGGSTTASDYCAHAEGYGTEASGMCSHAEGNETTASGQYSHAEGSSTSASAAWSHAEGSKTTASANGAHAEGSWTTASGQDSHAEGIYSKATGNYSHAEGSHTQASKACSHAEGLHTYAWSENQHVQGKYNIEDGDDRYAHIVGNGESNSVRSNAHTLDWAGNAWFAGGIYVGGTDQDNATKLMLVGTRPSNDLEAIIEARTVTITIGDGDSSTGSAFISKSVIPDPGFVAGDKYLVYIYGSIHRCICFVNGDGLSLRGDRFQVTALYSSTSGEYAGINILVYGDRLYDSDGNPITEVIFSVSHYINEYDTIDPRYIPDTFLTKDDLGDYIDYSIEAILPELTISCDASGSAYFGVNAIDTCLYPGEHYIVTWDGIEYNTVAGDKGKITIDGVVTILHNLSSSKDAITIRVIAAQKAAATHTLSIDRAYNQICSRNMSPELRIGDELVYTTATSTVISNKTFTPDSDGFFIGSESSIMVENGIYKVTWNGTEYECIAELDEAGNLVFDVDGVFMMLGTPNGGAHRVKFKVLDGSTSVTVAMIKPGLRITRKLDAKYLPDTVATKADIEAAIGAAIGGSY